MDEATFRQTYSEFADTNRFTSGEFSFWHDLAVQLLPPDRWTGMLDNGIALYVAHHLAIGDTDQSAAAVGATPGQVKGPLTGKTVDKVSASYDSGAVTLTDAGFWNMTSYGIRFLNLARIVGTGGIQL